MPEWGWIVLIVLAGVLVLVTCVVLGLVGWLIWNRAKGERLANEPPWTEPPPALAEMDEEEKSEALESVLASGQTHAEQIKEQWAEEKRAQGWSSQDIEDFLENRPVLELN